MPTYEYQCDQCRRTFEIRQRITEDPLTRCEACGGPLRRLLSAAPFILKGEGWYVTDYPSEARKKGKEAETGGAKTGDKATEKSAEKAAASAEKSSTPSGETPASTAPSTGASSSSSA